MLRHERGSAHRDADDDGSDNNSNSNDDSSHNHKNENNDKNNIYNLYASRWVTDKSPEHGPLLLRAILCTSRLAGLVS